VSQRQQNKTCHEVSRAGRRAIHVWERTHKTQNANFNSYRASGLELLV